LPQQPKKNRQKVYGGGSSWKKGEGSHPSRHRSERRESLLHPGSKQGKNRVKKDVPLSGIEGRGYNLRKTDGSSGRRKKRMDAACGNGEKKKRDWPSRRRKGSRANKSAKNN